MATTAPYLHHYSLRPLALGEMCGKGFKKQILSSMMTQHHVETLAVRLMAFGLFLCSVFGGAHSLRATEATNPEQGTTSSTAPLAIGSELQLFVDHYIIDSLDQVELRLQQPCKMPMAKNPACAGAYATVLKDGDLYRAYWRERVQIRPAGERPTEIYRYAESQDGVEWEYPSLGIIEFEGSTDNNVMFMNVHNFSPFLDARPGVAASQRYKAVAGRGALQAFDSPDGIHWTSCSGKIAGLRGKKGFTYLIEKGPEVPKANVWMDSQNVVFWSEAEQLYVCYFRSRLQQEGVRKEVRVISRVTSPDFYEEWSKPVVMEANLSGEDLYTSQTQPYFRAPHLYVATPTRLLQGGRQGAPFPISLTEVLFMSSRPGSSKYDRLFKEAFIRPGLDPVRWGSMNDDRANYVALNVVPTGPAEMSIYHKDGHRYVLRTDGFVAVHAAAKPGEILTKYFTFTGENLLLNYSTSASGNLQVEIQDETGTPIPGFRLQDGSMVIGDAIEQPVPWKKGSNLNTLAGRTIRLRFVLADADLFSFRFQ